MSFLSHLISSSRFPLGDMGASLSLSFHRPQHKVWQIQFIRLAYYLFVSILALIAQASHPYFINHQVWPLVYSVALLAFGFHLLILLFDQVTIDLLRDFWLRLSRRFFPIYKEYASRGSSLSPQKSLKGHEQSPFSEERSWERGEQSLDRKEKKRSYEMAIFILDAVLIAILNFLTFLNYPTFVTLHLINIALCAFFLGSPKGLFLTGGTCFLYTVTFLLRAHEGDIEGTHYLLNLIIFYFTAIISGYLGGIYSSKGHLLSQTKKELMALQNLSQVIIQNIGNGLLVFNTHGRVSFFNEAAQRIFGSQVSDLKLLELDQSSVLKKSPVSRVEVDIDVNNKTKSLEFITTPLEESKEEDSAWISLVQDLTEIKTLQKELGLKEKLAAIGQLAGGIAHEIRNPLASISGSVEMLHQDIKGLNSENNKLFSIIIREIERLNLLITDFLSFVHPEVCKSDNFSLKNLIEEIFSLIKFDKELMCSTQLNFHMEEFNIQCDKGKLKQVFLNIITNGLQALKGAKDPVFHIKVQSVEGFALIEFNDNGSGISQGKMNHIFEPFYTTKEKGTGLGLAIVHRIIEGHKGQIKVQSKEKKGTTFSIKLPITT